jgi:hypothetical protein
MGNPGASLGACSAQVAGPAQVAGSGQLTDVVLPSRNGRA